MDFDDYLSKLNAESFSQYAPFVGVVEDNMDPMAVGRVKARAFGFHPEDRNLVPTEHLPWAIVAQPTTSASISGVGWSPNGITPGTWVLGYFADGKSAQYPIITHTLPGIHRPNPPGMPGGNSAGYLNDLPRGSGGGEGAYTPEGQRPYHNELVELPAVDDFGRPVNRNSSGGVEAVDDFGRPIDRSRQPNLAPMPNSTAMGKGAAVGSDSNMMLGPEHIPQWESLGLTTYSYKAAPNGYACKDGKESLLFHYGTALAFENLTAEYGKGKMEINSAYRTPAYNARQPGAAATSLHMQGRALDISFRTIGASQADKIRFGQLAVKHGFVGFGLYPSFMHIDTGEGRTWNGASDAWFKNALIEAGWSQGKRGLSGTAVNAGAQTPEAAAANPTAVGGVPPNSVASGQLSQIDRDNMIRTIHGEARGEGPEGQSAVANVIRNRAISQGKTPTEVVKAPSQFSAWNAGDPNRQVMESLSPDSAAYQNIGKIVDQAYAPGSIDPTGGATHYYAPQGMSGGNAPSWFPSEVAKGGGQVKIGNQIFAGPGAGPAMAGANPTTPSQGFVDPTNSLPKPEYRGTPSTHVNARGMNSGGAGDVTMGAREAGRLTGFPAAGNVGTFGEPEFLAAPQYPYNQTYGTISGHLMEWDDSPGAERVNIEHKTGSGMEIFADGQVSHRTKGNDFTMISGDAYQGVMGKYYLTSVNDLNMRSTADMTQHADGSLTVIMGNDGIWQISGDATISVGEDIKIKGGARIVIEGHGVDILSHADMNLESVGDFTVKAGGKFVASSGGDASIKAPTVHLDDIVRMAEGGAPDSPGADSADVGAVPGRSEIAKDNLKTTTNTTKVTTFEEASQYYSGGGGVA